jgi:hypothetical protein
MSGVLKRRSRVASDFFAGVRCSATAFTERVRCSARLQPSVDES